LPVSGITLYLDGVIARIKAAFAILIVFALAPTAAFALPEDESADATPLEQAREESSVRTHPRERFELPAGRLRLSAAELLAAAGERVELSVTLDRDVAAGKLEVTLPRVWTTRSAVSGLPFARVPETGRTSTGRARARRGDRVVSFSFDGGRAGDVARFTITDAGIPAGTYRLPYRWRGAASARGTATVIFYAPTREAQATPGAEWSRLASPGLEVNATDDALMESETFLSVVPGNRERFILGANGGGGFNAWVTNDGGQGFTEAPMPTATDVPGEANPEVSDLCCDPMSAADSAGNLWYGGLSFPNGPGQPSRIVINRIAPGATSFEPFTVGLTQRTSGTQDKPMMTIDNSPSSPHFGRLYVVWDEPFAGGVNLVISQCDTRLGGILDAAHCDNADNWSAPVSVTPATGSYIYADVAAAPDGTVDVVWWDYSATNAIRGDSCGPAANCAAAASWGTPQTIATLNSTGGTPVPFACPILAQPGGRAGPSPQLDVDRSGGTNNGRVYVTWGDLRAGSGTTKCMDRTTIPAATHLSWDSFVGSAAGGLPGSANPSSSVATRLLSDGEAGGQANSDDWFPWLAVDQTTGQAWADFYSTRDDATRETTNFYARSVTPSGTGHALGPLTRVSGAASDHSAEPCCSFGNDYGDYTGIDATQGIAFPVWSDMRAADLDGEAYVSVLAQAVLVATNPASPAADTTPLVLGSAPAGSTVRLYTAASCTGAPAATGSAADLAAPGIEVTVPSGTTSDIRATATLGGFTSSCSAPLSYTATAAGATTTDPSTGSPLTSTPDTSVTLDLTAAAVQRALRTGGLRVRASCRLEACRVSGIARVSVPSRRVGARPRRIFTKPAWKVVGAGERATLTLRFSRSLRTQISRALRSRRTRGRIRAAVRVTAVDAAANTQTRSTSVRIRR
jgi:hypothetical protein